MHKNLHLSCLIFMLCSATHATLMNTPVPGTSTGVSINPNIIMNPNTPVNTLNSTTTAQPPIGPITTQDADITTAVQQQIAQDPSLAGATIQVSTQQGFVTLSGTTKSMVQVTEAVNMAQSVKGVLGVHSNLTIISPTFNYQN